MAQKRLQKALSWVVSGALVLLLAAYIVAGAVIRSKIRAATRALPPNIKVTFEGLHPLIFQSALVIRHINVTIFQDSTGKDTLHFHHLAFDKAELCGVNFLAWVFDKRLSLGSLRLVDCRLDLDRRTLDSGLDISSVALPFRSASIRKIKLQNAWISVKKGEDNAQGDVELDSISMNADQTFHFSGLHVVMKTLRYTRPGTYEMLSLTNLEVDSKKKTLSIDTLRIIPTVGRDALGKIKGHQVDYIDGSVEGISVTNLETDSLYKKEVIADSVRMNSSSIYVFRDRRLPLETEAKPMPVDYLKSLPISLRIQSLAWGPSNITYEEHPKDGDKTGYLKILKLRGRVSPLINKPRARDPEYMMVVTNGSLMGSGSVEATTRMPLRKGDSYKVDGAFHNLDVTSLNPSAENLGDLHLESGLLNYLSFGFDMNDQKASGKIVGEYHNLSADKLKDKNGKKETAKFKTFVLKNFIIPRDKDKSLPIAKRTGKVDYKRDPERYFSYYMMHALLVGVKDSFSLGALLPG